MIPKIRPDHYLLCNNGFSINPLSSESYAFMDRLYIYMFYQPESYTIDCNLYLDIIAYMKLSNIAIRFFLAKKNLIFPKNVSESEFLAEFLKHAI